MAREGANMRDDPPDPHRFTDPVTLILVSLLGGPKRQKEMIDDIHAFSLTLLAGGTLDGALGRLEEYGWVRSAKREGRRRTYRLTREGYDVMYDKARVMLMILATYKQRNIEQQDAPKGLPPDDSPPPAPREGP
jgi:DNA-binding PadR family transcriptional regulator